MRPIRTTQPTGHAQIDWSNPLTQGLTLAYIPTVPFKHLVTGGAAGPLAAANVVYQLGAKGRAFTGAAAINDGVSIYTVGVSSYRPITSSTDFAIAVLAAPPLAAGFKVMFNQRNGSGNAESIIFNIGSNGLFSTDTRDWELYVRNTAAGPFYADNQTTHSNPPDGLVHLWGGSMTASVLDIWRDGANVTETRTTPSGTFTSPSQATRLGNLANYATDGAYANTCPMFLTLVWGARALTAKEWRHLARNPWQVFTPLPSRVYSPAAAGATFNAAWASAANTVISGGARVA